MPRSAGSDNGFSAEQNIFQASGRTTLLACSGAVGAHSVPPLTAERSARDLRACDFPLSHHAVNGRTEEQALARIQASEFRGE